MRGNNKWFNTIWQTLPDRPSDSQSKINLKNRLNKIIMESVKATHLAKYSLFLTAVPQTEHKNSLKSECDRLWDLNLSFVLKAEM
jgi:hypothetical protein